MTSIRRRIVMALIASVYSATVALAAGPDEMVRVANGDLQVKLAGALSFFAFGGNQDVVDGKDARLTANKRNPAFITGTYFKVEVLNETDEGFKYGARIGIITTTPLSGSDFSMLGTFIFVEHGFGKVEAGAPYGASAMMAVCAKNSAAAGGDGWKGITKTRGGGIFVPGDDMLSPQMSDKKREPARKISWYSPIMSGSQIGISYTPDTANTGGAKHSDSSASTRKIFYVANGTVQSYEARKAATDVIEAGVKYTKDFGNDVKLELGAVGEWGKAVQEDKDGKALPVDKRIKNLFGYNIGSTLTFGPWIYAVSYMDVGSSFASQYDTNRENNSTSATIAHKNGPFCVSLTFINALSFGNKATGLALGANWKPKPGLKFYAEVGGGKTTPASPVSFTPAKRDKTINVMAFAVGMKVFF